MSSNPQEPIPHNQSGSQNQPGPHNESVPHNQSVSHNQAVSHNQPILQNQSITPNHSIPHPQSASQNAHSNPELVLSIFDPYPGSDSSDEEADPPFCLGFDLNYVNMRREDLPDFETEADFHRFISNRACGTIDAAMRYQQWWPANREGASDDSVNELDEAEEGYEDLRDAYDEAMTEALTEARRGRVCCETHAQMLGTRRHLAHLAMTAASQNEGARSDGNNDEDEEGDEEGDEENSEEGDDDMAPAAAITADTANVNVNDMAGGDE